MKNVKFSTKPKQSMGLNSNRQENTNTIENIEISKPENYSYNSNFIPHITTFNVIIHPDNKIDQGLNFETSKKTEHITPKFVYQSGPIKDKNIVIKSDSKKFIQRDKLQNLLSFRKLDLPPLENINRVSRSLSSPIKGIIKDHAQNLENKGKRRVSFSQITEEISFNPKYQTSQTSRERRISPSKAFSPQEKIKKPEENFFLKTLPKEKLECAKAFIPIFGYHYKLEEKAYEYSLKSKEILTLHLTERYLLLYWNQIDASLTQFDIIWRRKNHELEKKFNRNEQMSIFEILTFVKNRILQKEYLDEVVGIIENNLLSRFDLVEKSKGMAFILYGWALLLQSKFANAVSRLFLISKSIEAFESSLKFFKQFDESLMRISGLSLATSLKWYNGFSDSLSIVRKLRKGTNSPQLNSIIDVLYLSLSLDQGDKKEREKAHFALLTFIRNPSAFFLATVKLHAFYKGNLDLKSQELINLIKENIDQEEETSKKEIILYLQMDLIFLNSGISIFFNEISNFLFERKPDLLLSFSSIKKIVETRSEKHFLSAFQLIEHLKRNISGEEFTKEKNEIFQFYIMLLLNLGYDKKILSELETNENLTEDFRVIKENISASITKMNLFIKSIPTQQNEQKLVDFVFSSLNNKLTLASLKSFQPFFAEIFEVLDFASQTHNTLRNFFEKNCHKFEAWWIYWRFLRQKESQIKMNTVIDNSVMMADGLNVVFSLLHKSTQQYFALNTKTLFQIFGKEFPTSISNHEDLMMYMRLKSLFEKDTTKIIDETLRYIDKRKSSHSFPYFLYYIIGRLSLQKFSLTSRDFNQEFITKMFSCYLLEESKNLETLPLAKCLYYIAELTSFNSDDQSLIYSQYKASWQMFVSLKSLSFLKKGKRKLTLAWYDEQLGGIFQS